MAMRDVVPGDLARLVALDRDPGVKRFIDNDGPVDEADLAETLSWWLGYHERTPGYGFWMAFDAQNAEFFGWFHLRLGEGRAHDEPELGYRLHRACWGRGLATEGSAALIEYAFDRMNAQLVYAETMAVHTASRHVMERIGMALVRSFHADWPVAIPGDEFGDVEYAITREQWKRRR